MRQPLLNVYIEMSYKSARWRILVFEFGMVQSTVNEWIHMLSAILKKASRVRGV